MDGTGPFSFAAAGLPIGLVLDEATGAISGVPAEAGSCVTIVTAKGKAGEVTAELVFDVQEAPSKLIYKLAAPALRRSEQATLPASVDGSHPLTFESDPPLPQGLSIDAATGDICGVPVNADDDEQTYTVTVSNCAGMYL